MLNEFAVQDFLDRIETEVDKYPGDERLQGVVDGLKYVLGEIEEDEVHIFEDENKDEDIEDE